MDKTFEITAKNGISYKFVEWSLFRTMVDTYSWYNNKWNRIGKCFDSMEDAKAWIEELNADYEARMNAPKVKYTMPEGAYYSITGYYGD
ncbi:MAG: hypothetical protein UHE91_03525 [Bacteroidales bacterium]|jgi:hypothetical protein|nr:hypothetical protein [Bacteroidales bacterium]